MIRRPQFRLRSLFLMTAVVAVGIVAWPRIVRPAIIWWRDWIAPPPRMAPVGSYIAPKWQADPDADLEAWCDRTLAELDKLVEELKREADKAPSQASPPTD
jgi:hypothetical protein